MDRAQIIRDGRNAARHLRQLARTGDVTPADLDRLLGKIDDGFETALDALQLAPPPSRSADFPETLARLAALGLRTAPGSVLASRFGDHGIDRQAKGDPIDPDVWALFKADYLRAERPSLISCWRRSRALADSRQVPMPSPMVFRRRLSKEVGQDVLFHTRGDTEQPGCAPNRMRTIHGLGVIDGDRA